MAEPASKSLSLWDEVLAESQRLLHSLPDKRVFLVLFLAWSLMFHFWGSSTFGHIDSSSLFAWLLGNYNSKVGDDGHGLWIPLVVLFLVYWKRAELREVTKTPWWPALFGLAGALLLHLAGFLVQQQRLSTVAFFGGFYFLMGIVWGRHWLKAIFFPFFLFGFSVPIGQLADMITLPLRIVATKISVWFCQTILQVDVLSQGTQILGGGGRFALDVAPACSGIRSLISMLAVSVIYSFLTFRSPWKRAILIFSSLPLALLGNVIRLSTVIVVAEAFGEKIVPSIEQNMGFVTFAVSLGGMMIVARFLREKPARPTDTRPINPPTGEPKTA